MELHSTRSFPLAHLPKGKLRWFTEPVTTGHVYAGRHTKEPHSHLDAPFMNAEYKQLSFSIAHALLTDFFFL